MYKTHTLPCVTAILATLLLLLSLPFGAFSVQAEETDPKDGATKPDPSLSASCAILYEPSFGETLLAKNADKRMPMASTTKIMTALAALSALDPNASLSFPAQAVGIEGSSAYFTAGEELSVRDLLYALLLQSANDAAVALALAADGSVEAFATRMNRMAEEMGLKDTHFENPHGLHSDAHYTTARELALITARLLQNELLREIVSTKVYTAKTSQQTRTFVNHNKLLSRNKSAIGVKTGFTKASGRCLVGAAEENGMTLISVTLNAPNDWNDHEAMWRFGFSEYEVRRVLDEGAYYYNASVIGALVPYVSAVNRESVSFFSKKNAPEITVRAMVLPHLVAPLNEGDIVGYLGFYQEKKELCRIPLYAKTSVPRANIRKK